DRLEAVRRGGVVARELVGGEFGGDGGVGAREGPGSETVSLGQRPFGESAVEAWDAAEPFGGGLAVGAGPRVGDRRGLRGGGAVEDGGDVGVREATGTDEQFSHVRGPPAGQGIRVRGRQAT